MTSTSRFDRALEFVIDRYFTVDLRTLGLFRIAFGLFLLGSLYDRTHGHNAIAFFTDEGVLPAYVITQAHYPHRWSLMYAVTTITQVRLALAIIYGIYVAYAVGWHTRLMQILAAVAVISLDQRNLMLENGGAWVTNIAVVTTSFLPLGDRFSLDALRVTRPVHTNVARWAYGFLLFDLAAIYSLNALAKKGAAWKDGTAIDLALWHTRVESSAGAWLRVHEPAWFSPAFGRSTLVIEFTLAALILSPVLQREMRRTAIVLILGLHISLAVLMTLGPFAYVMMCLSLLLLGPDDWEVLERLVRPRLRGAIARVTARLEAAFGPRMPPPELAPEAKALRRLGSGLRDTASVILIAAGICSLLLENKALGPIDIGRMPEWAAVIVDNLRFVQSWHMFAPEPYRENGTIVVDGELEDHEHVDPLTGRPPDFEAVAHAPFESVEIWREYFFHIGEEKSARLRPYFRDYLLRLHTLPGARIHEPLVHFDVYWISCRVPPLGRLPARVKKTLLFSGDAMTKVDGSNTSESKVEVVTVPASSRPEPPTGSQPQ